MSYFRFPCLFTQQAPPPSGLLIEGFESIVSNAPQQQTWDTSSFTVTGSLVTSLLNVTQGTYSGVWSYVSSGTGQFAYLEMVNEIDLTGYTTLKLDMDITTAAGGTYFNFDVFPSDFSDYVSVTTTSTGVQTLSADISGFSDAQKAICKVAIYGGNTAGTWLFYTDNLRAE